VVRTLNGAGATCRKPGKRVCARSAIQMFSCLPNLLIPAGIVAFWALSTRCVSSFSTSSSILWKLSGSWFNACSTASSRNCLSDWMLSKDTCASASLDGVALEGPLHLRLNLGRASPVNSIRVLDDLQAQLGIGLFIDLRE